MRHRRWIEYIKDYDFGLKYHPGKANVVVDAIGRKAAFSGGMIAEWVWIERLKDLDVCFQPLSD